MRDDNDPLNEFLKPFRTFKEHVNDNIGAGIHTILDSILYLTPYQLSRRDAPSSPALGTDITRGKNLSDIRLYENNKASEELERHLDELRNHGTNYFEAARAWRLFLLRSSYSPVRLSLELGWKPVPKGLTSEMDPALFGWEDAFEDLLAASSAKPMRSIESHWFTKQYPLYPKYLQQNKTVAPDMLRALDMDQRIRFRKLDEAWFPLYSRLFVDASDRRYCSPRSMDEWIEWRKEEAKKDDFHNNVLSQLVSNLGVDASRWTDNKNRNRDEAVLEMQGRIINDVSNSIGNVVDMSNGFFDNLNWFVNQFDRALTEETERESLKNKDLRKTNNSNDKNKKQHPETEQDLSDVILSAFNESNRSLSTLFKSIASEVKETKRFFDDWIDSQDVLRDNNNSDSLITKSSSETTAVATRHDNSTVTTTTTNEKNGVTETIKKEEYTDASGAVHVKQEIIRKDAEGNVISRSSSHSVSSKRSWSFGNIIGADDEDDKTNSLAKKDRDQEGNNRDDDSKDGKKEGWFWK
ncbi:hypothetical protein QBC32DRAFT_209657 [Pseudoneurospora amorphoporcata]|uniref:Uncharacterized protein n=1 Tax=Pseudoneurospora amorphoporcata TaxID=241081 RepID=A0AAN6P133_9PEZI|nr:hypothetical protein QBC32DRAFT_209657 [Pseudoneurospora amorphoporcata]